MSFWDEAEKYPPICKTLGTGKMLRDLQFPKTDPNVVKIDNQGTDKPVVWSDDLEHLYPVLGLTAGESIWVLKVDKAQHKMLIQLFGWPGGSMMRYFAVWVYSGYIEWYP